MGTDIGADPKCGGRGRATPIDDFWAIYFRWTIMALPSIMFINSTLSATQPYNVTR